MFPARRSVWTAVLAVATLAATASSVAQARTSDVQTIYSPTAGDGYTNPGVMYARPVTLRHNGDYNGTVLTTFEAYKGSTAPVFPVYQSTGGAWTKVGEVRDTVNGYGMRWNPQIYELPAPLGILPAGTILVSGLSVPADFSSTEILLYASTDRGRTFQLLSSVAKGGRGVPGGTNTPVWEPFLLMRNGKLIVYYSDERDKPNHSQKLVHQVTSNGRTWGPVVDDVSQPAPSARPGMTTVAPIGGGRWILTYEYCGHPAGGCPVYYRIANDPENFRTAADQQIVLNDGVRPCCQPYVVWTPSGGPNGTIVVGSLSPTALAINTADGDPGAWRSQASNAPGGYSRSLMVMPDGNTVMTLTGGDHDSNYLNKVQYAFDHIAPGISNQATYTLTNALSGLNLGATNSTSVTQQSPSTSDSQKWTLTRQANGYFTLRNVSNKQVLTGTAAVDLRPASPGSATQDWAVTQLSDGSFQVANRRSQLLLDAVGRTPGALVAQWPDNGGADQRWTLTQTALPDLTVGDFTLQNTFGKYLEIPAGSTATGTQADQWWYADQPWHLWRFTAATGGFRITNVRSGLALTDTHPAAGDRITQEAVDNSNGAQVWTLVAQNNRYLVRNTGTGRVLTIAQGSPSDLAKAVSWTEISTPDQYWTVRRVN